MVLTKGSKVLVEQVPRNTLLTQENFTTYANLISAQCKYLQDCQTSGVVSCLFWAQNLAN